MSSQKSKAGVLARKVSDPVTLLGTPEADYDNPFSSPPTPEPSCWSTIRSNYQDVLSEFMGTFIFLLFSLGVIAQVVLSDRKNGDYTLLCLGWG